MQAIQEPDPAARPVARAVLARLLSGHDLSAGLLTEGARQAKLAARMPEIGSVHHPPAPARSRSGVVLWSVACAVCVLAIAVGVPRLRNLGRIDDMTPVGG